MSYGIIIHNILMMIIMDKLKRWRKKVSMAEAFYRFLAKRDIKQYIWFYEMLVYYGEKLFNSEE